MAFRFVSPALNYLLDRQGYVLESHYRANEETWVLSTAGDGYGQSLTFTRKGLIDHANWLLAEEEGRIPEAPPKAAERDLTPDDSGEIPF